VTEPDVELAGLHLVPDPSAERREDGTVLVGGSPMRLLRLSPAGAALVDRLWDGEPVPAGRGATALARRLLDAGLAHPAWCDGPAGGDPPHSPADVTVVVPVRGALAPGLLDVLGPVAAVVVVDDATPEPPALPPRTPDGVPVQVVRHDVQQGPGAARTTGLGQVTTALVAFVDADSEPRPGWLDALLPHFTDPKVAVVAPRITAVEAEPGGLLARYETACSALDMGPRAARVRARSRVGHVPSAALVARADVVRQVGGFDPELATGEDVDLVWRLDDAGWTVRYEPAAHVGHHHRTTAPAWARRRADYGAAAGPLARRHPGLLAPIEVPIGGRARRRAALMDAGASPALADELLARGRTALVWQLARATVRPWWPVTLVALALAPRRLRRWLAAGVLTAACGAAVREWVLERPHVDPATFVVGRLADDVAYSYGVWRSALDERTAEPLVPQLRRPGPPTADER
jgi:mycofactocin system glycosyltransferase